MRRWAAEGARLSRSCAELLGRPSIHPRSAVIRVGLPGRAPFEGSATVALRTLDSSYLAIAGTAFAGLLVGLLVVSRSSDLLREGRSEIGSADRRPFSLGRTQMAVWFFIVVASFPSSGSSPAPTICSPDRSWVSSASAPALRSARW